MTLIADHQKMIMVMIINLENQDKEFLIIGNIEVIMLVDLEDLEDQVMVEVTEVVMEEEDLMSDPVDLEDQMDPMDLEALVDLVDLVIPTDLEVLGDPDIQEILE